MHSPLRFFLFALLAAVSPAQPVTQLEPYRPESEVTGKLIAWGNPDQGEMWNAWIKGFARYHPKVQFVANLKSSATISGALFTSVANIGLAGREMLPGETLGFRNIFNYEMTEIVIGSGSYDSPKQTPALGVFVHKDNPLNQLTLSQLDAIYSRDRRRGAPVAIRTWGQLGLTGEWKDQPIHIYGHDIEKPATAFFFALNVFNGSSRWTTELKEFSEVKRADGSNWGGGPQIAAAVGDDRLSIGYTGFDNQTPRIKALALAPKDGGPYYEGSRANVRSRAYPLTRSIYLVVNISPTKEIDPTVREFVRYALSREGQEDVGNNHYVPLNPENAHTQLQRLN
jgi:phosphate transport system substrate-binding protein